MDPITISLIVSAVTALGTEVGKGFADEAGKQLWKKIQSALGLAPSLSEGDLVTTVEKLLKEKPKLGKTVYDLLQTSQSSEVVQLVGKIDAEKVIVVKNNYGPIQM